MIIYGWNKQKEKNMGEYQGQGDACARCEGYTSYRLMRIRTWVTIFFIPIICYRTIYYKQCMTCGARTQLDKNAAHDIMDQYLPGSKLKMQMGNVLRYLVMATAVVLLVLGIIGGDDEQAASGQTQLQSIKAMVSEDGQYRIYDDQARMVADITVTDGQKDVTHYCEYKPYENQADVTNGHTYTEEHHYYENEAGKVVYREHEAITTRDESGVLVEFWWFDAQTNDLYCSYHVKDFNKDIKYEDNKSSYIFTVYTNVDDEPEAVEYSTQMIHEGKKQDVSIIYYHGRSKLDLKGTSGIEVFNHNGDRNKCSEKCYYPFNFTDMKLGYGLERILNELASYEVDPLETYQYSYYKNTVIPTELTYSLWDDETESMVDGSTRYQVEEQENGYYVAKVED